jgi:uncharacterized membrane protein
MKLQLIIAVITCVVGIAFVFKAIPPNRLFGVCTPRTLSSPAAWYRAHRAFGLIFLILGLVILVLLSLNPTTPVHPATGLVALLLVVAVAVFVYRRYAA